MSGEKAVTNRPDGYSISASIRRRLERDGKTEEQFWAEVGPQLMRSRGWCQWRGDAIAKVPIGTSATVELTGGGSVEGVVRRVTGAAIVVETGAGEVVVMQRAIARVKAPLQKRSVKR